MSRITDAMVEMCRALRELDDPDVEFYWDNGLDAAFRLTKVPTIKVRAGGLEVVCDHEGTRKP